MTGNSISDCVGFLAAGLTLITFLQSAAAPMRMAAIGANLSFIAFGILSPCYPVLVLHTILLPINIKRLHQAWQDQHRSGGPGIGFRPLATPASRFWR